MLNRNRTYFRAFWDVYVIDPANLPVVAAEWKIKPVAICRLKRIAADHRDDITDRLPQAPKESNGKKVALLGAGCAFTWRRDDLLPLATKSRFSRHCQ